MSPAIENPEKFALPAAAEQVLQAMFAGYRRVVIKKTSICARLEIIGALNCI
jgi:hypothetical protein